MFDIEEAFTAILILAGIVVLMLARWDVARRAANRASSIARKRDGQHQH